MSGEEATITINRNPTAPEVPKSSALLDAQAATQRAREGLKQGIDEATAKAEEKSQQGAAESTHEPIEDIESVEVELPNGLVVEFGPPRDISLTMKIVKILGDTADSSLTAGIYKILLSVRAINGKKVAPITNTIDAEVLANKIGDAGIDILLMVMQTHWKPIRLSALPVIKKNLR